MTVPVPSEPLLPDADRGPSRRRVLVTGGVAAAAAVVTAACGGSGGSGAAAPSSPASGGSAPASSPAGITLQASQVPVGGGTILPGPKVVVTQPTAGSFKAFTAVCTHMGCTVASVADGTITCPCHGSQYSIVDGSVKGGPAPAPLAPIPLTVAGGTITVQ